MKVTSVDHMPYSDDRKDIYGNFMRNRTIYKEIDSSASGGNKKYENFLSTTFPTGLFILQT